MNLNYLNYSVGRYFGLFFEMVSQLLFVLSGEGAMKNISKPYNLME